MIWKKCFIPRWMPFIYLCQSSSHLPGKCALHLICSQKPDFVSSYAILFPGVRLIYFLARCLCYFQWPCCPWKCRDSSNSTRGRDIALGQLGMVGTLQLWAMKNSLFCLWCDDSLRFYWGCGQTRAIRDPHTKPRTEIFIINCMWCGRAI